MEMDSNLLKLARERAFGKSAFVPAGSDDPAAGMAPPPPGAGGPMGMPAPPMGMGAPAPGGAPPPAPGGAPPPMDPAQQAAMSAPLPGSMPGGMPPQAPPGGAPGAAGPQKLKPEQMMQMIDMRLYNMQMQLTAIMNAVQAKVEPSSLVLPPGMTSAPQAEMALPGGPMDPGMQQQATGGDPAAAGGGAPPMDPAAAGGAPPMDPAAGGMPKQSSAIEFAERYADNNPAPSFIGSPTDMGAELDDLQKRANTLLSLLDAKRRQAA